MARLLVARGIVDAGGRGIAEGRSRHAKGASSSGNCTSSAENGNKVLPLPIPLKEDDMDQEEEEEMTTRSSTRSTRFRGTAVKKEEDKTDVKDSASTSSKSKGKEKSALGKRRSAVPPLDATAAHHLTLPSHIARSAKRPRTAR